MIWFAFLLLSYLIIVEGVATGELSKHKCKEYAKYVPEFYHCPFSNSDITLRDTFATREEFPHMVMLGYQAEGEERIKWLSSASLISENFVLVAAHSLKNKPVLVKIGVTDLNSTDNLQEIRVKEVYPHPDFNPKFCYNDIGLVELERKVDINVFARPACLFTEKEISSKTATNSGWGAEPNSWSEFNDNLQKVNLEIYDEQDCNNIYKRIRKLPNGITYDKALCAGTKSIITNQPSSGGPLLILLKDDRGFKCMYDIIGVAACGHRSGMKDSPDVYTRVSAFIPWIEEIVWK